MSLLLKKAKNDKLPLVQSITNQCQYCIVLMISTLFERKRRTKSSSWQCIDAAMRRTQYLDCVDSQSERVPITYYAAINERPNGPHTDVLYMVSLARTLINTEADAPVQRQHTVSSKVRAHSD